MIATLLLAHIGGVPVEELLTSFPASMGIAFVLVLASAARRQWSKRR